MNSKALVFAIVGALVALFYAFESYLQFQANGVTGPLFAKVAICGIGGYFFWRNFGRIRKFDSKKSSQDTT